jgi:hypothetical protein
VLTVQISRAHHKASKEEQEATAIRLMNVFKEQMATGSLGCFVLTMSRAKPERGNGKTATSKDRV